jgi:hypothetical protein
VALPGFAAVVLCVLPSSVDGQKGARWIVDPVLSLAWWQIDPHLNHLWATTCPREPSWRPGEGRGGGWNRGSTMPKGGYQSVSDTSRVPLYPRFEALPLCVPAVSGEVVVLDTLSWTGVSGEITVDANALTSGEERRDDFTRETLLQANRYPLMRFRIDSLIDMTRQADSLLGTAVGILTVRDVIRPVTARLAAWPEAGGLRVTGRIRIDAGELTTTWGLSSFALGLGVGTRMWHYLFVGVDVVLKTAETPAGD